LKTFTKGNYYRHALGRKTHFSLKVMRLKLTIHFLSCRLVCCNKDFPQNIVLTPDISLFLFHVQVRVGGQRLLGTQALLYCVLPSLAHISILWLKKVALTIISIFQASASGVNGKKQKTTSFYSPSKKNTLKVKKDSFQ
jgi:hypothetical protein